MSNPISFTLRVNGKDYAIRTPARRNLADALREDCGLTGTHLGCEHGVCGACTVLLDGRSVRSCLMLAVQATGHRVTTIEGIGSIERPHAVQRAFSEKHGLQCGFCTPGFILSTIEYLRDHPTPTQQSMQTELSGNICRCTGYVKIFKAVERAAELIAREPETLR